MINEDSLNKKEKIEIYTQTAKGSLRFGIGIGLFGAMFLAFLENLSFMRESSSFSQLGFVFFILSIFFIAIGLFRLLPIKSAIYQ